MTIRQIRNSTAAFMAAIFILSAGNGAAAASDMPRLLVPMGCTVGIQMKTDGIVVVALSDGDGESSQSPAGQAGVLPGDIIVKLGQRDVVTAEDFIDAASKLDGTDIAITIKRGEKLQQMTITPRLTASGDYQLGLLLRDGVSGIGTVTFYDPETGLYGALGHPISDIDTGQLLPLESGSIMRASVVDIKKGLSGEPGELCGMFSGEQKRGDIELNTQAGIFGTMTDTETIDFSCAIPVAASDEVELGPAVIYSNLEGETTDEYEIEISRVYRGEGGGRNFLITVTDDRLIEKTGGIVQGMSGSPIMQNGKLIGAVTHVLIQDPTRGYAIAIEDMLSASQGDEAWSIAA